MANKPNNPSLWSKAKSLAKQKFDVYPSAYANGWAAKWYKSKGGTWRKAQYGMEVPMMEDGGKPEWLLKAQLKAQGYSGNALDQKLASMAGGGEPQNAGFQALPEYVQNKIMSNMAYGGSAPVIEDAGNYNQEGAWVPDWGAIKSQAKKLGAKKVRTRNGSLIQFDNNWNIVSVDDNPSMAYGGYIPEMAAGGWAQQAAIAIAMKKAGKKPKSMDKGGEPDGEMALGQIAAVVDKMDKLRQFIGPDSDLEPWISSKLAVMDHYADAVSDYMTYGAEGDEEVEESEIEESEMEEMKMGGIPQRYKNMGFNKVGVKKDSTRPGKKWMVLAKKGDQYKVVHGGYTGMKDYTQHGSEKRRENFWNRMGGRNSSKATDPFSPLHWHKRFGTWEMGGQLPKFQGDIDPSQVMSYDPETDTYASRYSLPEVTVTGKAPRDSFGRKLTPEQMAFNRKVKANNPLTDLIYESTAVPAALRIGQDPTGTAMGIVNTAGDAAMLPLLPMALYNDWNNPLTGVPYGEGLPQTMDALTVLPAVGPAFRGASAATRASVNAGRAGVQAAKQLNTDLRHIYNARRIPIIQKLNYLRQQANPAFISAADAERMQKIADAATDLRYHIRTTPDTWNDNAARVAALARRKNALPLLDSDNLLNEMFNGNLTQTDIKEIHKAAAAVKGSPGSAYIAFNPTVTKKYRSLPFKTEQLLPELSVSGQPSKWVTDRINLMASFNPYMGWNRAEELIHVADAGTAGRGSVLKQMIQAGRKVQEAPEGSLFTPAHSLSSDSFTASVNGLKSGALTGGRPIEVISPSFSSMNSMGSLSNLVNRFGRPSSNADVLTGYMNRLIQDLNQAKGYNIPYSYTHLSGHPWRKNLIPEIIYPELIMQTKGAPLGKVKNTAPAAQPVLIPEQPINDFDYRHGGSTWSGNAWYNMGGYVPEFAMGGMPCYACGGVYEMGGHLPVYQQAGETGNDDPAFTSYYGGYHPGYGIFGYEPGSETVSASAAKQQPSYRIGSAQDPSIVNYLASRGKDFSKQNRAKMAKEFGIENYTGTAAQNAQLLAKLRAQENAALVAKTKKGQAPLMSEQEADNLKTYLAYQQSINKGRKDARKDASDRALRLAAESLPMFLYPAATSPELLNPLLNPGLSNADKERLRRNYIAQSLSLVNQGRPFEVDKRPYFSNTRFILENASLPPAERAKKWYTSRYAPGYIPSEKELEGAADIMTFGPGNLMVEKKYGGIHINPANKGKFTTSAKRAGMGVQEFAAHVLANKEDYSSTQVKRANFARNAAKWKKQDGGPVEGDVLDVTPEELERLRQMGYQFEMI